MPGEWLTDRVRSTTKDRDQGGLGKPRRRVLRAVALAVAAAGPLTACDLFDSRPARPDPLAPLLAEALHLAERYETTIATFPDLATGLRPVAQAHREHATELARLTRTTPRSGSPTAGTGPTSPAGDAKAALTQLRAAEQRARETAEQACLAAPAERAALVGSIAAARASHLEMLR